MSIRTFPDHPILLVDDEAQALESFSIILDFSGINNLLSCRDETTVMGILEKNDVEVVLLDMIMPAISGESLLEEITLQYPDIPVIMMTAVNDVQTAFRCMRKGAFDYLTKPTDAEQLSSTVKRAIDHHALKRQKNLLVHHILTDSLTGPEAFSEIITADRKMMSLFMYCEAIARGNEPVLITGETGVGKELFARAIHLAGGKGGEFVAVNVAGVDEQAFSDTLFGHRKGAFTGAAEVRRGLIETAAGGTLFLDEIGDLPGGLQVKLLRVLQDREYFPLGSDRPHAVEARIVVATNKELEQLAHDGSLRQDLYYRLRTHHVHIPPLRERVNDIPLLLDHYLEEAARAFGKAVPHYPPELVQHLMAYSFPGNIRELRAMVYDAVGKHAFGVMSIGCFREHMDRGHSERGIPVVTAGLFEKVERLPTIKEACKALVAEAMSRARNNQRLAAAMLGITPSALNKRLNQ